jgi:hypothetical protein
MNHLETHYRLNTPWCIAEAIEDDLIIINLATGRYYNMRQQSVSCWGALAQGVTPAELLVANTWDADQTSRFKNFLQYLLDEQLLVQQEVVVKSVEAPRIELIGDTQTFLVDVFTDMQEMLLLDPIHDASKNAGWPNKA